MKGTRTRTVLSAVAALSAASCRSSSTIAASTTTTTDTSATAPAVSAAVAPSTVDSCTAVTQAEAGGALGQTVTAPVRGRATVEGGVACVFYGPNAPAARNADVPAYDSVRVVLVRGGNAATFFNDYKTNPRVHVQSIAGLGDQAYYDGYASLSVLKGDAYVRIALSGVSDVLDAEKKLAAAAVPRM
jgi:hypothetical protein